MQAKFQTALESANLPAWPTRAIILVAGRGRRLVALAVPKCLLEIGIIHFFTLTFNQQSTRGRWAKVTQHWNWQA